jgi:hypothetical protein
VLCPASPDLLAEKGLLQGTLVEKVLPGAPEGGLQAGDVIIVYERVYDLVMARYSEYGPIQRLKNMAGQKVAEVLVIRGDKVLTLDIKRQ